MNEQAKNEVINHTFGNYRIVSLLGTGGMGRVYLWEHIHPGRQAAIKLLHLHLASDENFRARFLLEARAASMLEHPHIVQLADYGDQAGRLYLIMELMTEGSLRTLMRSRSDPDTRWSVPLGLELVRQAAEGL